jgi:glycosyltransferase involved in cell wall biosynthesis
MRVLAMTSLFPNPYQPVLWSPNRLQLSWLAKKVPVRVIAPIPWTTERAGRHRSGNLTKETRRFTIDNLDVEQPTYWFPPGVWRSSYGRWFRWSVRSVFERAVREFQPTVIFAYWAYPDGWAAVKLGHEHNLPVVIQVMGSDVLQLAHVKGRTAGTAEALREADGVWAVSQDLANHVIQFGAKPERVKLIYDGVDTSRFHPGSQAEARARLGLDPTKKIILFVGNLVPVKAIDRLLLATEQLATRRSDLHVAILGQGDLQPKLESLTATLQCRSMITFYGSKPQETLPDWYRAADVFALPSDSEGVPNVLLEASACGLPYVASHVGGIHEIADRGHGTLVPVGDVTALAAALEQVLNTARPAAIPAKTREACMDEFIDWAGQVSARR